MQQCFNEVVVFQTLCGKLDSMATKGDLLNQAKLIMEEARELYLAIENNEGEEQILKETCDNLVVLFGMAAMLQRSGYQVTEAFCSVNKNNMSKFCTNQTDGYYTLYGYESTEGSGFTLKQVECDKWGVFNRHNKLMKPINYKKCSVKQFTPSYIKEN